MKNFFILLIMIVLITSFMLVGISCKTTTATETTAAETTAAETTAAATTAEEGVTAAEEGPKYGGILRIASVAQPTTLDNHKFQGQSIILCVTDLMNDFLYRWNEDYTKLVPHLAKSWEWNEDKTVMTLELRNDVKFHNGEGMTTDDVKASLERCMDPDVGSGHYSFLAPIQDIEIIDNYNMKIILNEFTSGFEEYLTRIAIMPKSIIESDPDSLSTNPIGAGPFKFVEWIKDQAVVMEKFDDYYIDGVPYLDGIEWRAYAESSTMHIALENQEIDMVYWSDSQQVVDIPERNPEIKPIFTSTFGAMYLAFNTSKPPFDNKLLRKAVRYAIDPRSYAENYSPGCRPVLTMLEADPRFDQYWNWDESWYDLEKAKQYLEEAGYPNGEGLGQITVVGANNPERYMSELVQAQLKKIGINCQTIVPNVPDQWPLWRNGDFNIAVLGSIGAEDPGFAINSYFIPGGALTWAGFFDNNQEIIDLYNQAIHEIDATKRDEMYVEIYNIVLEELPLVYLHNIVFPRLEWDYVKGGVYWPDVMSDLTTIWLDK